MYFRVTCYPKLGKQVGTQCITIGKRTMISSDHAAKIILSSDLQSYNVRWALKICMDGEMMYARNVFMWSPIFFLELMCGFLVFWFFFLFKYFVLLHLEDY